MSTLSKFPFYPSFHRHSIPHFCLFPAQLLCFNKSFFNSHYRSLTTKSDAPCLKVNGTVPVQEVQEGFPVEAYKVLEENLVSMGINIGECKSGMEYRCVCPKCKGGSKSEKCLDVRILDNTYKYSVPEPIAFFNCFRGVCGWTGRVGAFKTLFERVNEEEYIPPDEDRKCKRVITAKELKLNKLCDKLYAYFHNRGISKETLDRNGVMQQDNGQLAIAFPYKKDGVLVNCKYRSLDKKFRQEKNAEKIMYGLDDIKMAPDIIIVEGEIDKLSMEEAGFRNCVSVPDGAPPKASERELPGEEQDKKYQYIWNSLEYFDKASRIILATDGDTPGQALAEEIARRIGKERCWRVKWPKRKGAGDYKDANEVLMGLGAARLRQVIDKAELYPIKGLMRFNEFFQEIDAYYRHEGFELGVSTGWKALNPLYNVVPGELTIVSGVPNSGKSEWIDALLCNIHESVGWKFLLCSMENSVREHARKLLEKHIRKPFFDIRYAESVERMNMEELEHGKEWLDASFHLLRCEDGSIPSIKWILKLAKLAVQRFGVRGLVIDPYNELDHQRDKNQNETEYVSQMLTLIKRFAQHHSVHVWFVAHPRQMLNWTGAPPNLYDVSGSAHFINKCDNGIVVHRNRDPAAGPMDQVQICVRKVRNKCIGGLGDAFLSYNRVTGVYSDIENYPIETCSKHDPHDCKI